MGGGTQTPTNSYYDEIFGQKIDINPEMHSGYPPVVDLTEVAPGINRVNPVNICTQLIKEFLSGARIVLQAVAYKRIHKINKNGGI